MKPQEKAIELIIKFKPFVDSNSDWNEYDSFQEIQMAKQCAKIAVEEILKAIYGWTLDIRYWNEVLTEIDKI